jgi:DNA-binding GntR family transcriptional regulator
VRRYPKIAAQRSVSRGPVREALQLLVQERLLVRIPNRGVFVADITSEDVADLRAAASHEARCGARFLADEPLLRRTVLLLRVIVDRMGAAEQDRQWGEVIELDLAFRTTLVDVADRDQTAFAEALAVHYSATYS